MKKYLLFALIFTLILCNFVLFIGCNNQNPQNNYSLGVWWWNKDLEIDKYLSFAKENNITEIYLCDSSFNEQTKDFISSAQNKNIKVFLLAGEYQWLDNNSGLISLINNYKDYQNSNPKTKFSGIHLDIEPHQNPNFSSNRTQLITSLVNLVYTLNKTYPTINFDYDIPFWLNDEILYNNISKPAYEHIIDYADRTFLMSYRDSSQGIINVSKEEIEYAKENNKTIFLGVETKSNEGDHVSFQEEGKKIMMEEIEKLKKEIPNYFGISIHQIKTWYDLID